MEENSILKVLSQLENDLKDIRTAKEQIDAVLASGGEINKNLGVYNTQLAEIANQLNSLKVIINSEVSSIVDSVESDVRERMTEITRLINSVKELLTVSETQVKQTTTTIVDDYKKTCNTVSTSFGNKVSTIITSFEEKTTNVTESFEKAAVENSTKLISAANELKKSSTTLSSAKSELLSKLNEYHEEEKKYAKDLRDTCLSISQVVGDSGKKLEQLTSGILELKSLTQNLFKEVNDKCEALSSISKEQTKSISTNQKLILGGLLLIVVDIILKFM